MFQDQEEGNDVSGKSRKQFLLHASSETSPLLGATTSPRQDRPLLSLDNLSSVKFDSMKDSGDRNSAGNTKGWNMLRGHLHEGDLLLQLQQATDEKKKRSRQSLRRIAFEEFESGMSFGVLECITAIVVYLLVSILIFSYVLEPKWTIIDSCYFAVSTFTTLGPGDLTPSLNNSLAIAFTCIYVLLGVACLGIALGVLGNDLLDTQHQARKRALSMVKYEAMTIFDSRHESDASLSNKKTDVHIVDELRGPWQLGEGGRFVLLLSGMMFLALWIGAESKWSTLDTFYYLLITGCTIGYGDLAPESQQQRVLAILFIPLACCVIGYYLGFFATTVIEMRSSRFRTQHATRELTQDDIDAMDIHDTGKVTWSEFLVFMLVATKKIDYDLVDELQAYFNKLDVYGSGELSREDLMQRAKEKLRSPRRKLELAAYKARLLHQAEQKKRRRPRLFRRLAMLPSFLVRRDSSRTDVDERTRGQRAWRRLKKLFSKGESMESFLSDEISHEEGDYHRSNDSMFY